jgi:phosphocarrier protein HPr
MAFLSRKAGTKTTKEVEIVNKLGLHARPCAKFVKLANTFRSEVWVTKDSDTINGKSIMGLMMLAAGIGSKLTIMCEGPDSSEMIEALEKLILSKFDED